jgi:hypothetical protein
MRIMKLRIDFQELGGGNVLAGALHGRKVLNELLSATATEPMAPEPVFLDFRNVDVATASFLRESAVAFREHIRGRRSTFYPVFANANDDIRDELLELARNRGEAFLVCTLVNDHVEGTTLLGELNPKQKVTFDLVREHNETDAAELMRIYGEREGVTQTTAWNNRLAALAALGLIVEVSQGRNKRYRPLF